ncbi:MAG: lamin tail domain-containing protein, partial [Verrucomicrobia subdivision 3 bacterium]|nr:lamin tail domain-containing protein [Limisphaerales bacterium]
ELEKNNWPTFGGTASTPSAQAIISTCCTQSIAHASDIIRTNYLPARRTSLYNRSPGELPAAQPSNAVIRIGAIEYNPSNANQEQEYIQFLNTNSYAVDMSFWSVTGAINYTFQGGMVMPANSQMYLSPNVVQFRARTTSPRGGQGLLVQGNYAGQLSARGETLYLVDRRGRIVNTNRYVGNPSAAQAYLRITEIMYHPAFPPAGSPYTPEDFEYIEIRNTGPTTINLAGVHFKNGVDFAFTSSGPVTNVASGAAVLLVKNLATFTSRYGTGYNIAGVYGGSLDNNGETIRLDDAVNEKILDFRYDDDWYPSTDGMGFSLVIVNQNAPHTTWDLKESWRPSGQDNGSPGGTDTPQPTVAGIIVNEVFTHSDLPAVDYIELYNPTASDVNIGGWFISDDFEFGKKFRIPDGTMIAAGGYRVFTETDFNVPAPVAFSFSSAGDEAFVFSGNGTNLTGYFHGYSFGAAETGVSFGRYTTSTGAVHFVAQSARTTNAQNALPKVGPIVISEIMYHPPDLPGGRDNDDHEFVELHNITASPVPLFNTTNTWRVRGGIDFDFPPNVTVPAGGYAILVGFHPLDPPRAASFRAKYNMSANVPLYGPYSGQLDNSSDRIELYKPDAPDGGSVPYVLVEEIEYSDTLPWPPIADGIGPSIQRVDVNVYGNDAVNWTAVVPTANGPYPGGELPVIDVQPTDQIGVAGFDATFTVQASGPPPLAYQWFFRSNIIAGATQPTLHLSPLRPVDEGPYSVIVFNGAGYVTSEPANLTVRIPAQITQQPTNVVLRGSTNAATFGQTFTNAAFYVFAASSTPITYQWRYNSNAIAGATNNFLIVSNVTLAEVGTYDVIVTDAVRPVLSSNATLRVVISPTIIQQPQSVVAVVGDTVSIGIRAVGSEPMGFRWRRNGVNVRTTNQGFGPRILTLPNVQTNQAGNYTVIITNAGNPSPGALSLGAVLTVLADADNDGAPDAWETEFGFLPNNGSDGAMDFDGDGASNADEFRAGTDPKDDQSYFRVEQFSTSSPTIIQFTAVSNRSYSVQYNDELGIGEWLVLSNVLVRPTNRLELIADPAAQPRRYYRLVTPLQDL